MRPAKLRDMTVLYKLQDLVASVIMRSNTDIDRQLLQALDTAVYDVVVHVRNSCTDEEQGLAFRIATHL